MFIFVYLDFGAAWSRVAPSDVARRERLARNPRALRAIGFRCGARFRN